MFFFDPSTNHLKHTKVNFLIEMQDPLKPLSCIPPQKLCPAECFHRQPQISCTLRDLLRFLRITNVFHIRNSRSTVVDGFSGRITS